MLNLTFLHAIHIKYDIVTKTVLKLELIEFNRTLTKLEGTFYD